MKCHPCIMLCCLLVISGCMTEKQWQAKVAADRKAYLDQWPKTSAHIRECMLAGKICEGMSRDQVKLAWPHDLNYDGHYWVDHRRGFTLSGTLELRRRQVIGYGESGYSTLYRFYFGDDGRLTKWSKGNR